MSILHPHLSLPQNDGFLEREERKVELGAARHIYTYTMVDGLPMPMASTKTAIAATDLNWAKRQVLNTAKIEADLLAFDLLWKAKGGLERFPNLASFTDLFVTEPTSEVSQGWASDASFAGQRTAGLNPLALHGVTANGASGIGWSELKPKLGDAFLAAAEKELSTSFDGAIAAGRLFACDYAELAEAGVTGKDDAGAQAGRVLMAPIGLFYSPENQPCLKPLGIQLDQPGAGPWATPQASEGTTWQAAKVFFQAADVSINQIVNHLGMVHLIQSSFAVATVRQLALQHPVHALLTPHYTALLSINAVGESSLLAAGGIVDQILEPGLEGGERLIQRAYEAWQFFDLEPEGDLCRRGCADTKTLPNYPYRDDGLLIWNTICDYVHDYLTIFYGDPASDPEGVRKAVEGDYELQAWASELSRDVGGKGNVPGFPSQIGDFETLQRVIQLLIWIAGPRHACVNFPQVDYTSFVPNQPTAVYLLPDAPSDQFVLDMMPPVDKARTQYKVSFQLAGLHLDELLDYGHRFQGSGLNAKARDLIDTYKGKLDRAVTSEIKRRNLERQRRGQLAYPYFLPANIPNSTSV